MTSLQGKIAELEAQGWVYDDHYRLPTGVGVGQFKQLMVMKKLVFEDGRPAREHYKMISGGKIYPTKTIEIR